MGDGVKDGGSAQLIETLNRSESKLRGLLSVNHRHYGDREVAILHGELDRLQELGMDVGDFRVVASDWSIRDQRSRRPGQAYVNEPDRLIRPSIFRGQRLEPALDAIQREMQRKNREARWNPKTPGEMIAYRTHLLASFVDAYMTSQDYFTTRWLDSGFFIHHPGLPEGRMQTEPTFMETLMLRGQIHFSQGGPTKGMFYLDPALTDPIEARASSIPKSLDREDRINLYGNLIAVTGPVSGQLAIQSPGAHQTSSHSVVSGDFESLRRFLEASGVSPDAISGLEDATMVDDEAGRLEAAKDWLAELGSDASKQAVSQLAIGGSQTLLSQLSGIFSEVVDFFGKLT